MHKTIAGAIVVLLAGLGVSPAAAADDVPWEIKPSDNSFGSKRPNYTYTLPKGGQVQDGFVVVNRGKTPLQLAVYAADAFTTDAGRVDLRTSEAKPVDVGAWVRPDRTSVKVAPGQSVQVPFRVALPDDVAPGDHLGGIVTSVTQAGDVERRVALRIRLRVSGELEPALAVDNLNVQYSGSDATVSYQVHNTGNAIIAARQVASVAGPFGHWDTHSGEVKDTPQLLPGESWKVEVPIKGVPLTGRLSAKVEVVPLLTDAAGSTAAFTAVTGTTHTWMASWLLMLLVVFSVVLVVALGIFLARRYGSRARRAQPRKSRGGQASPHSASRAAR